MVFGEVVVGDVDIVLHARFASEVTPPFLDGPRHLLLHPGFNRGVGGFSRGLHDEERIHEGVVDGALQVVSLLQAFRRESAQDPFPVDLVGRDFERAVGPHLGSFEIESIHGEDDRLGRIERGPSRGNFQRERGDVLGDHTDQFVTDDGGVELSAVPVLVEGIDLRPVHLVVLEGVGGEMDATGVGIAALGHDRIEPGFELQLRFRVVAVTGFGADEVQQLHPFVLVPGLHHAGGLNLDVVGTAVGDGRQMTEIGGVAWAVVPGPELLLVPGGREGFLLEDLEKVGRFREPGSRRVAREQVGVVDGHLPTAGPAHREAPHGDPILVDLVPAFHRVHPLQHIDFPGHFERVAVPPVGVEHERVGGGELTLARLGAMDEVELAQLLAPAMQPDIEPVLARSVEGGGVGNDQSIGLDAAIDLRDITSRDGAGLLRPGSVTSQQRFRTLDPLPQQFLGDGEFFDVEELVVLEGTRHGFVEDDHIGEETRRFRIGLLSELCQQRGQLRETRFKFGANVRGNFNANLRDGADILGEVIRRSIGPGRLT